ncbi:expressed hypothetical protein [Trichoplax adhaerens]|uniref:Short/branched chain specific acyl-CoA dehydrogenase, mitochondrial n=1 Tax=Trichoplax adhaerens TaxID=10228 RepID=B3RK82_TRIAD|nr:expressed hypothetical protein [Trichoplax adhaerens]EDV29881.1 expressed hypothetical protein [Trichoplax adhaerens]|eukprot:XP_002109083.1 expressed hypothetical protein [Trichoplax adhaerens]
MVRQQRLFSAAPLTQLSEDEQMLKDAVARYSKDKIAPRTREFERNEMVPMDLIQELFDQGWMSVRSPLEYGGPGGSLFNATLIIEELGKHDPGISGMLDVQNTLVLGIALDYFNEEQKKKYLTKLSTSTVGCFCLSEQGSGSDAFAMQTRAVRDGNDYVINGTKLWITNADIAGLMFVMANAAPDQGYKGITCFIVDASTPGVTVSQREKKLGQHAAANCPVIFEDVRVPASNVIGGIGLGYKIAASMLNEGRIGIGAQMLGASQGVMDYVVPYTMERKQFGKRLFDFQAMQHQIAEACTKIEAARLLVYNAARLKDSNKPYAKEAAIAKYYSTELAVQVGLSGIKWLGALGYMKDAPVEKLLRDSIPGVIYEGTSNIMLNTIAKFVQDEYK